LVGRLFGLGALVRSGQLQVFTEQPGPQGGKKAPSGKKGKASKASEQSEENADSSMGGSVASHLLENCVWCVKELLFLASTKSFLREVAVGVVLELIQSLGSHGAVHLLKASPQLQTFLKVRHGEATPEVMNSSMHMPPWLAIEGGGTSCFCPGGMLSAPKSRLTTMP
jgi:hypothetical protein